MFAGSGGGLSGEVGVGGCEMADTHELKAPNPVLGGELRELALALSAVGEQLLADVIGAPWRSTPKLVE